MSAFDFTDAPAISRASRRREDFTSACLGADLEWSEEWLTENCLGDGFFKHPLLAGPEGWRDQSVAVSMSGEIVDNRGIHSQATWCAERSRA
jgi:hypothetical protein